MQLSHLCQQLTPCRCLVDLFPPRPSKENKGTEFVMNSKAIYWIALGVFALGLNSEYQKGNLPVAHRVADRAEGVFCRVATRVEQTWVLARILTGHQDVTLDDQLLALKQAEADRAMSDRQADVDRVIAEHQADLDHARYLRQADLDRVQRNLGRMNIVLDRVQVEKLRKLELVRFKVSNAVGRRVVVCPQTGVHVMVNAQPDVEDAADVSIDIDSQ
jgi:hypothetical protein